MLAMYTPWLASASKYVWQVWLIDVSHHLAIVVHGSPSIFRYIGGANNHVHYNREETNAAALLQWRINAGYTVVSGH